MSSTIAIVLVGSTLGVLQIATGILLGMWIRRPSTLNRDADLDRARKLAVNLQGMTERLGHEVSEHRNRFERMEKRLAEDTAAEHLPTTDLVVGVVGEILKANRQLQSELHDAESQLAEQAAEIESHLVKSLTDPLTELPNRRALDEQLVKRLEDYRKHGTSFSLMMFDLDHFKQINDKFGHAAGDNVLKDAAATLKRALRKHDFVTRYGGEEFAVVLPYTSINDAEHAADKVASGFEIMSADYEHFGRPISGSGGLASIEPGESLETLLQRADQALYEAKRNGRKQTYIHDGSTCRRAGEPEPTDEPSDDLAELLHPDLKGEPLSEELIGACHDLRSAALEFGESR